MADEKIDYGKVVAKLKLQRAALENAITALQALADAGGANLELGDALEDTSRPVDPATIRDDAFFGLSIAEAAKKYLTMVKRKQSVKEIADALERGGLPHTSSNFANTVATMMNRSALTDAEIVRVGRGEWGLSAWYGNRRPKPEPRKKKSHKKAPAKSRAAKAQTGQSLREMTIDVMKDVGGPMHIDDIMKQIEVTYGRPVKKDSLGALFSIAVRKGDTFTKTAPGVFGLIE